MKPEAPITIAAVQANVNLHCVLDCIPKFAAPQIINAVNDAQRICRFAVSENRQDLHIIPEAPPPTAGKTATMEQHAAAADESLAAFMELLPAWANKKELQNGRAALAILLGRQSNLQPTMQDRHTVAMEYIAAAEVIKHIEADLAYQQREGYPEVFNKLLQEQPDDKVALAWKRENTEQNEALESAKAFMRRYRQPPTAA